MITAVIPIQLKPNQILRLVPLGDIHFLSKECDEPRFLGVIDWLAAEKKRDVQVKVIGMGDYLEMPSPSERAAFLSAKGGYGMHDTTLEKLDEMYESMSLQFAKAMTPLKGDGLGLLSGHHFVNFAGINRDHLRGINTDELICRRLDYAYLGTIAMIRLKFKQVNQNIDIWAHHGFGSARTKGAKLTKRLRVLEGFRPHIILMGHDNSKFVDESQQIVLNDDGTLRYEKVYAIGTGSFQKGYESGRAHGGFAEEQAFSPNGLGCCMINFQIVKGKLDYHVSI